MKRLILALLLVFCGSVFAGQPLRTNTATEIMVDLLDTSGDPVESLTTIGDLHIRLFTIAYNASSVTMAAEINPTADGGSVNDLVHEADGMWTLELEAANVNFVGRLNVSISDPDNDDFVSWSKSFEVYAANVFDSLFGGDYIDVQLADTDHTINSLTIDDDTGNALTITTGGGDGHGVVITGHGDGEGISVTGGATGIGMEVIGGSTSGSGMKVWANGTNDIGLEIAGLGTGSGMQTVGGAEGHGIRTLGGATAGNGIFAYGQNEGDGIYAIGSGTSQHGIYALGGATTSAGIYAKGGASSGPGIYAAAQANNDAGMELVKHGTGKDIDADIPTVSEFEARTQANSGEAMVNWLVFWDDDEYDNWYDLAEHEILSDMQEVEGSDATTYIDGRTLAAANYFLFGSDDVAKVTLVATTTASTDAETAIGNLNDFDPTSDDVAVVTLVNDLATGIVDHDAMDVDGSELTAINLPNQTMTITGDITGNLSGSVGTVTGGVSLANDAITAAKVHAGTWQELIELLFTFDATASYGDESGSVVDQVADNASGTGTTPALVWAYATRILTALDEDSTTIDIDGSAVGSVTAAVTTDAASRTASKADVTGVTTDAASRTASKADVSALATSAALSTHDGKLDTVGGYVDTEIADIIDKLKAIMSKAYSIVTAVGTFDPATDSLEAQQENPQGPPIFD